MTGHVCPECGTPRGAGGRAVPGCHCAARASEAVGAGREAEIAATRVFDPLRVRPYVSLRNVGESGSGPETVPLLLPDAVVPGPGDERDAREAVDLTNVDLTAVDLGRVDLSPAGHTLGRHRGRRRPYRGLLVVAAAVAVAGTAAFASGLFSGDDERDKALPDRETSAPSLNVLPDAPSSSPTGSASQSASASETASASPSVTPSADASLRMAPGPSAPSDPSTPPATASASGSVSAAPLGARSGTLRPGDSGPEVVELQQRLAEVSLYSGPMDGQYSQSVEDAVRSYQYDRHVKGDQKGVYGPKTRRELEAETQDP
ncbi:peptidoglycan-binding domain-containing protein [Streptomyces sp. NPDC023998]|uniref:peptidoglycan-binding domain-containing protein n=1 Tax=Streptomyces sp. NPDC023998 TaxID=3154597 RepID=UPI0034016369